jgi:hypothetical protein
MKFNLAKIFTIALIFSLFTGCTKKDNIGKLYLKFVGVNKTDFANLETVIFSFQFSHPNNEVAQDRLLIRRKFVNCINTFQLDTFSLPEFQATKDYLGNFELSFRNGGGGAGTFTNPCFQNNTNRTDSVVYTFRLLDKSGNFSDSVSAPQIILRR